MGAPFVVGGIVMFAPLRRRIAEAFVNKSQCQCGCIVHSMDSADRRNGDIIARVGSA